MAIRADGGLVRLNNVNEKPPGDRLRAANSRGTVSLTDPFRRHLISRTTLDAIPHLTANRCGVRAYDNERARNYGMNREQNYSNLRCLPAELQ